MEIGESGSRRKWKSKITEIGKIGIQGKWKFENGLCEGEIWRK